MTWLLNTLFSSIGKKIIMALTGLFLCSFLVVHLAGNLFLFVGPDAFNEYSENMVKNPVIRTMEIFLFLGLLFHVFDGIRITQENRRARPVAYAVKQSGGKSTIASKTMFVTGSLVFIFLVVHLKTFWFRMRFGDMGGSTEYDIVVEAFRSPAYAGFYIFAMALLGFHLNHGFQSAFQSLGFNHKRYSPLLNVAGTGFSYGVALGFAAMPAFFMFGGN